MTVTATEDSAATPAPAPAAGLAAARPGDQACDPVAPEAALVEEDLLVEDVSIDGMCGVY
jgi:mycofactocin precursor